MNKTLLIIIIVCLFLGSSVFADLPGLVAPPTGGTGLEDNQGGDIDEGNQSNLWERVAIGPEKPIIKGDSPRDAFEGLVVRIMDILFTLGFIIMPLLIVGAGFMYMVSAGDATRKQKARKVILWGIIGLIIIICGRLIMAIIEYILK